MKFVYDRKFELCILNKLEKDYNPKIFRMFKRELNQVKISKQTANQQIKFVKQEWKKVEDNFYKQLGNFYNKKLSKPEIACYLSRLPKYPYDFKGKHEWFCAPFFVNPAERNKVIMHELCHYFQPIKLPRPIKEAIPVILNDHEVFQMYSIDRGHNDKEEQAWRKKIWKIYKKGEDFEEVLKEL